ncbi:MAG: PRC-barrel domain-containing protein [Salinarimonas sp.]|nr:PRC-barrel domain-containing protein [Salinarimonas sp.]
MTDETTTMATFIDAAHESDILASEIMGASVFAYDNGAMQETAADTSTDMRALRMIEADERNNLEEIGSIADVLVDQDGTIRGVIVGVGGFLGIGEREVALGLGQLTFARDADDPDNLLILAQVDAQMLEEAPEFDRQAFQQRAGMTDEQETAPTGLAERDPPEQEVAEEDMDREETMAETRPAQDAGDQQWRQGREPFTAPEFEREGYARAEADSFSVDTLLGANVYDVNDDNVGSVDDIMVNGDGEMQYVVMDIGGFLGIGAHTVALGLDEVTILHDGEDSLRLYVDVDEDTLRNMPEYQG